MQESQDVNARDTGSPSMEDPVAAEIRALRREVAALAADLRPVVERQERFEDLLIDGGLIARDAMATWGPVLAEWERKGAFAFLAELGRVAGRVMEAFGPEDVRALGDNVVTILQTVRNVTQPDLLGLTNELTEAVRDAEDAEPLGLLGVLREARDEDVKRGLAVLLTVLRQLGRAVERLDRPAAAPALSPRARALQRRLAPRRARRPAPARAAPPAAPAAPGGAPAPAPARVAPQPPAELPPELAGVVFDAGGHFADPAAWKEEMVPALARLAGIEALTEEHWKLIRFARGDWEETGAAPNIRRITLETGTSTRDVYRLFPRAPARTIARIAGIPKPAGCV